MNFGERLIAARKYAKLTQAELARKSGISQSVLSDAENGAADGSSRVVEIADACGVSPRWLSREKGPMVLQNTTADYETMAANDYLYIHRAQGPKLSAGDGSIIWDYDQIEKAHAFRKDWMTRNGLKADHCKLIPVEGDSMQPTVYDGDLVLINMRDRDPKPGNVYAFITPNGLKIKRVTFRDGIFWLTSDNKSNPRYVDEPVNNEGFAIIGKAIWRGGEVL